MINFCTVNVNRQIYHHLQLQVCIACMDIFLSYRVLETFAVKVSNSVRNKIKKKSRLMNKEKQKQTRAILHFFLCYGFFFELVSLLLMLMFISCISNVLIPYPKKAPENHMLSGASRAYKLRTSPAKCDHH